MKEKLRQLEQQLEGELFYDITMRTLYATDASAYREMPLAVAIPKTIKDIKLLIRFAKNEKTSLIPRTAGTSLAGQVVGNGIIVDPINITRSTFQNAMLLISGHNAPPWK